MTFHKPIHTPEDYRRCVAAEMTKAQCAEALGVALSSVCNMAFRHRLTFKRKKADAVNKYRVCQAKGMTVMECAAELGIKPHSVRNAASRLGIKFRLRFRQPVIVPEVEKTKGLSISTDAISRYFAANQPAHKKARAIRLHAATEASTVESPERTMWQRVVLQALLDATVEAPKDTEAKVAKAEAIAWITSGGKDFQEVCGNAGSDPDFVRDRFLAGKICPVLLRTKTPTGLRVAA